MMRRERETPPKARLSLLDRISLAASASRHVDGIWIGSFRGEHEDLTRIVRALALVKQHSPVHYSCIINNLERIWISVLRHNGAEYNRALDACVFDERFLAHEEASTNRIASAILHEATHARIERYGIIYEEGRRVRIESICLRRELALAARLPDGAQLRQLISGNLEWHLANPDFFSDAQFRERRHSGEVEALRHVGMPEWLIRATPAIQSAIGRVRRLFRLVVSSG